VNGPLTVLVLLNIKIGVINNDKGSFFIYKFYASEKYKQF